jgi:hypothetical protein
MRKQPVYILIDSSISMAGKPIKEFEDLIKTYINSLRQNPFAIELVYISIILYSSKGVTQLLQLTSIYNLDLDFELKCSGKSDFQIGIDFLINEIKRNHISSTAIKKGDYTPMVIVLTGVVNTFQLKNDDLIFLNNNVGFGWNYQCERSVLGMEKKYEQSKNSTVKIIVYNNEYVYKYYSRYFSDVSFLSESSNKKLLEHFKFVS